MKTLIGLSAVLVMITATVLIVERSAISYQRSAQAALRQETERAASLVVDPAELERLRSRMATNEAPDTTDLPRLRNQVRQLREQVPAVEKLRADNDRLAAELTAMQEPLHQFADLPGFVPKEKWSDAGLGSPENALQTFFGAISAGNVDRVVQCLEPQEAQRWQAAMGQDPKQGIRWWQEMLKASGYRIVKRKEIQPPDVARIWSQTQGGPGARPPSEESSTIRIEVQAAGNGVVMGMDFKRYGGEWKVESPFQPAYDE